jgi:hypothetical protein
MFDNWLNNGINKMDKARIHIGVSVLYWSILTRRSIVLLPRAWPLSARHNWRQQAQHCHSSQQGIAMWPVRHS